MILFQFIIKIVKKNTVKVIVKILLVNFQQLTKYIQSNLIMNLMNKLFNILVV
jgi:hypothetical protein